MPHPAARITGMNTANYRDLLDHREDFVLSDFHRDSVSIAISHQAAGRAAASHAKASGIIDDDQIGAAFLDEFGADASAGTGSDDWSALFQLAAQAFDDFFSRIRVSFSGPRVGHS